MACWGTGQWGQIQWGQCPAPVLITVSSIDIPSISVRGGQKITATGTFLINEAMRVYVGPTGTTTDTPAFSGVSEQGFLIFSQNGTTLSFIAPPFNPGAQTILIIQEINPSNSDTLVGGLTYFEAPYFSTVFSVRRNFPRWYATGPRRLDLEPRQ